MMIRLIAIAAATLAISTSDAMAETDGDVYRDLLALSKINSAGSSGTTMRCELPMRAIVNGHPVQPRRDCLDALGYSDLSPQEAEEVGLTARRAALVREQDLQAFARYRRGAAAKESEQAHAAFRPNSLLRMPLLSLGTAIASFSPLSRRAASK